MTSKYLTNRYTVIGKPVARFPILPLDTFNHLAAETEGHASTLLNFAITHDVFSFGLSAASPPLLDALRKSIDTGVSPLSLTQNLAKYLIRACSRATPFGAFSGVAVGTWGDTTEVQLGSGQFRASVRADMRLVVREVQRIEACRDIRASLSWTASQHIFSLADRLVLSQVSPLMHDDKPRDVSIRATPLVRYLLGYASRHRSYQDLLQQITERTGSSNSMADGLLHALIDQGYLISHLRPRLIYGDSQDPNGHIPSVDGLAHHPAAEKLTALRNLGTGWSINEQTCRSYIDRMMLLNQSLVEPDDTIAYQVDTEVVCSSMRLTRRVQKDVCDAASLLLLTSNERRGPAFLAKYRAAFLSHYEEGQEVPLLELFDPDVGISGITEPSGFQLRSDAATKKDGALYRLAMSALDNCTQTVELDVSLFEDDGDKVCLPPTVDVCFQIAAISARDIDEGKYKLVISPFPGTTGGGRMLGRFGWIMPERAAELSNLVTEAETDLANDDSVVAELSYLPTSPRMLNVSMRTTGSRFEVASNVSPSVPAPYAIPISELSVGLNDGTFYVKWSKTGQRVLLSARHLLNYQFFAPEICQFLSAVSQDGMAQYMSFDWGQSSEFPYLPRVQHGRVVLRRRQWRVGSACWEARALSLCEFRKAVEEWRARWNVPELIQISDGDHLLLLNLKESMHLEILRKEVRKAGIPFGVVVMEFLPDFNDTWVVGAGGRYVSEFVSTLRLRDRSHVRRLPQVIRDNPTVSSAHRKKPCGSDWLYAKVYVGGRDQDKVLKAVSHAIRSHKGVERWFFIRYGDPMPHLRIRINAAPDYLQCEVVPHLSSLLGGNMAEGVVRSFSFDTYTREVERYGGAFGVALAEQLWGAETTFLLDLLEDAAVEELRLPMEIYSILGIVCILIGVGLKFQAMLAFLESNYPTARPDEEMKKLGPVLKQVISSNGLAPQFPGEIASLQAHCFRFVDHVKSLFAGHTQGEWYCPKVWMAYVHMHCNRWLGTDRELERAVMAEVRRLVRAAEILRVQETL